MDSLPEDQYEVVVENVKKSYDGKKLALDGISFHIKKGEIYGLLGKNGAGKSTTIKILTTLINFDSGTCNIAGYDLRKDSSKIRKIIGVVQQEESFDFTTVENNFKLAGMLWEVLVLDEPTVGLDPIMRRKILQYIREQAKNGLTILFTTQNLEEADMICDRIGIIDGGKIVEEGTSEELKLKFGTLRTVKITTQTNVEKYMNEIKERIKTVNYEDISFDENKILILGKNVDRKVGDVIGSLYEMGIEVENVSIENPTLDDVFMRVVER